MKFDYNGYNEEELIDLCLDRRNIIFSPFPSKYVGGEFYSLGTLIKKFAYFPSFLPLNICYDHGITMNKKIFEEQKEACDIRFTFAKWRENIYKQYYKKVKTILFPFIFYRQKHNIVKSKNAKGTLIFVHHDYDQEEKGFQKEKLKLNKVQNYIQKIKSLPKIYHPVCVCMHVNDIRFTGFYKYYLEAGIPVYTAGNEADVRFVKRFYNIIKNFKYTMAPEIGSACLYSVDLGIPFAILTNNKDNNNSECYDCEEIFSSNPYEKIPQITQEQIEFFIKNTAYKDSISRFEAAKIVWGSFFKYICTKEAWRGFGKLWKNLTNRRFYKSIIECIKL